ncbi:MAG: CorA family divalent cation transporter [Pseudomonadota bacterium]
MSEPVNANDKLVRHFRQILVWPLHLMPIHKDAQTQRHWELLEQSLEHPWREVADEFTENAADFKERHYNEFVTFLPYVQRFLYGESRNSEQDGERIASPMRVYRREDVAAVRITPHVGAEPLILSVAHIDLYFFYDIDVVLLNVEVHADDLPLQTAQNLLYSFGRAYPASWDAEGQGLHCPHRVEWIGINNEVMATSDYEQREKYLSFACHNRAASIASHWAFLLQPMVLDHADEPGLIRFRQIEFYRMPVMGYLAMENPRALSRSDFIRLGLVSGSGSDESLPFSERHVSDFEQRYCYDRYWSEGACSGPDTRYLCNGHALMVIGDARHALFTGKETGVLSQFRHQYFLLFMIAHMQRSALLMFSDLLVAALDRLDIQSAESVRRFKRAIRQNFETFLRFTHRYWFHELSDQVQVKALYRMCTNHLETEVLHEEVKKEIYDMSQYLDSDSLRRQANTVVRLTVVTTFGLIGTVVTGLFGMNLFGLGERSPHQQWLFLLLGFAGVTAVTFYTLSKSKRLSDFLDAVSDDRLPTKAKFGSLINVWRKRNDFE